MFRELKNLLTNRALTITVASSANDQIRVNVVPHSRIEDKKANDQISYSHKSEVASVPDEAIKALTTPISITGTAEEIDEKFPAILTNYVESHVRLQDSLDRATSDIAAAVKAIDERNKAKTKSKQGSKEEKDKSQEQETKKNESLPLWWTDPSAAAPGAAQPAPTASDTAAPLPDSTPSTQTSARQA
jgi:PRTRC genetic system protein E